MDSIKDSATKHTTAFFGSLLANLIVEYTDRKPKKAQSMLTFWPSAAVTQTLPQLAAFFAYQGIHTKDLLARGLFLTASARLLGMLKSQYDSRTVFMEALKEAGVCHERVVREQIGQMTLPRIGSMLLSPVAHILHHSVAHFAESNGVRVISGVTYAREEGKASTAAKPVTCDLQLDVLYSLSRDMDRNKLVGNGETLPVFVYIHGGGWVMGNRHYHSLPVLMTLARAGWAVVSVDYRLAHEGSMRDMVADCKTAIAWTRANIQRVLWKDLVRGAGSSAQDCHRFSGTVPRTLLRFLPTRECPTFLAVGGESAGGHLACVMGLTGNDPRWQPVVHGVPPEEVDTSVGAVVDLYGVHDITDRHGHFEALGGPGFRRYMRYTVVQDSFSKDPALFHSMSPTALVEDALVDESSWCARHPPPPFFGAHGDHDSLVPVEDSVSFYDLLKKGRSRWPGPRRRDALVVVPGAPHAFNNSLMPWTFSLGDACAAFLHDEYDVGTVAVTKDQLPFEVVDTRLDEGSGKEQLYAKL